MKTIDVAALALNAALYVAIGVLLSTIAPISFGGVRFWPQVIIPAVFAVVFGKWVGGIGAAVGIFISDLLLNGLPLLSLMAGVTSNFAMFFLIGYIAERKVDFKKTAIAYGIITVIFSIIAFLVADIFTSLIVVGVVIASYIIFLAVSIKIPKWISFEAGSVIGLLVGSAIIGLIVPVYFVLLAPQVGMYTEVTSAAVLSLFTWTFVSEIPFLLILGPPILGAIYKAFPTMVKREQREAK
jgi:hypothetical protein